MRCPHARVMVWERSRIYIGTAVVDGKPKGGFEEAPTPSNVGYVKCDDCGVERAYWANARDKLPKWVRRAVDVHEDNEPEE